MAFRVLAAPHSVTCFIAHAAVRFESWCRLRRELWNSRVLAVVFGVALHLASVTRTRAENRADYRYEDYAEENGRIHVQTHGVYFDTKLSSWLSLKGNALYDAIAGATPTGAPFLRGTKAINTVHMDDKRYAGFLEPTFKIASHTVSPQLAYSEESDYRSIGAALNDAIELNEKNTTLLVGLSHSFDHILPNEGELYHRTGDPIKRSLRKDDSAVLAGVAQLLGPVTLLTANLTLGYSDGFLNDPYKRVLFDNTPYNPGPDPANPFPYTVWPESRPGHKFRQVLYLSLQHYVDAANGALDASYRLHHDDFGITAHTLSLQWNQKIGKMVTVSPLVRFHTQSAANFYGTHFPGDPSDPSLPVPMPRYYSADYRLSALNSFTYGISLGIRVHERVSLELEYVRYEMAGTDHVTSSFEYPKANTITGGLTAWF